MNPKYNMSKTKYVRKPIERNNYYVKISILLKDEIISTINDIFFCESSELSLKIEEMFEKYKNNNDTIPEESKENLFYFKDVICKL